MQMPLCQVLMMTLAAGAANAQIRLPSLPLPNLPLQTLPQDVGNLEAQSADRLHDLRRVAAEKLIRTNRRSIDADPAGEPIVRDEILLFAPIEAVRDRVRSLGFVVDREQEIAGLNIHVAVLKAPTGMSAKKALRVLRDADPGGVYDYNHIYIGSGIASSDRLAVLKARTQESPSSLSGSPQAASHPVRIGLLDSGIETSHPVFGSEILHTWGCAGRVIPASHGTAVASLLVGRSEVFHGVRPDAELYAADVYCGAPTGGAVDALVAAFGWMVREKVPVINVSLVGPKNLMLERVVASLIAGGYLIVAAVGNDGPAAPPLYPASYPHVVGVTALDAHRHVLIEAAHGAQVLFAASGADMPAAALDQAYQSVRGTSFAAPIVAALLAGKMSEPDAAAAAAAVDALAESAIDLGPPGKDLTYGFGWVGSDYRVDPAPPIKR